MSCHRRLWVRVLFLLAHFFGLRLVEFRIAVFDSRSVLLLQRLLTIIVVLFTFALLLLGATLLAIVIATSPSISAPLTSIVVILPIIIVIIVISSTTTATTTLPIVCSLCLSFTIALFLLPLPLLISLALILIVLLCGEISIFFEFLLIEKEVDLHLLVCLREMTLTLNCNHIIDSFGLLFVIDLK